MRGIGKQMVKQYKRKKKYKKAFNNKFAESLQFLKKVKVNYEK
jgi:hypothetical protein